MYLGKAIAGGQDAEAALTFDQFRQDQTVYPDYANRPHFEVYDRLGKTVLYELKLPVS